MRNNPVPFYSTFQPSIMYRLRHSRIVVPLATLLATALLAFATAMVWKN